MSLDTDVPASEATPVIKSSGEKMTAARTKVIADRQAAGRPEVPKSAKAKKAKAARAKAARARAAKKAAEKAKKAQRGK